MNKIKVLSSSKNKENHIIKTLFLTNSFKEPRVIGFKEQKDYHSNSAFDYMMLKSEYESLERKIVIHYSNIKFIRINNQDIQIQSKRHNSPLYRTMSIYKNLMKYKKLCCSYCKKDLSIDNLTIDHFIPKHCGGSDSSDNLNVSCFLCNRAKAVIHPIKDTELFNHWKDFIKTDKKAFFIEYLLKNKIYSIKDYNFLITKLQPSISIKMSMYKKMLEENIVVDMKNFQFNVNNFLEKFECS